MSNLKCLVCENPAAFSIRTKSLFNYSEEAFYIDAIYCLSHYREELKRIYDGVGVSMTPDYKALSVRKLNDNNNGTVQVMQESELNLVRETDAILKREDVESELTKYDLIGPIMEDHSVPEPFGQITLEVKKPETEKEKKMKEVMDSIIVKPVPVEEPVQEEEVRITKMSPLKMRQKTFEDQVLHTHNIMGITKSYDIAKYLHRPRGSVYNAMRRLGLRPTKAKRKGYNTLPEHQ